MAEYKIKTEYNPPPIPIRTHDWEAWVAGTEDEGMVIGFGSTEAIAVADLMNQLQDLEDVAHWRACRGVCGCYPPESEVQRIAELEEYLAAKERGEDV